MIKKILLVDDSPISEGLIRVVFPRIVIMRFLKQGTVWLGWKLINNTPRM